MQRYKNYNYMVLMVMVMIMFCRSVYASSSEEELIKVSASRNSNDGDGAGPNDADKKQGQEMKIKQHVQDVNLNHLLKDEQFEKLNEKMNKSNKVIEKLAEGLSSLEFLITNVYHDAGMKKNDKMEAYFEKMQKCEDFITRIPPYQLEDTLKNEQDGDYPKNCGGLHKNFREKIIKDVKKNSHYQILQKQEEKIQCKKFIRKNYVELNKYVDQKNPEEIGEKQKEIKCEELDADFFRKFIKKVKNENEAIACDFASVLFIVIIIIFAAIAVFLVKQTGSGIALLSLIVFFAFLALCSNLKKICNNSDELKKMMKDCCKTN